MIDVVFKISKTNRACCRCCDRRIEVGEPKAIFIPLFHSLSSNGQDYKNTTEYSLCYECIPKQIDLLKEQWDKFSKTFFEDRDFLLS